MHMFKKHSIYNRETVYTVRSFYIQPRENSHGWSLIDFSVSCLLYPQTNKDKRLVLLKLDLGKTLNPQQELSRRLGNSGRQGQASS